MQAAPSASTQSGGLSRKLSYLLAAPLTVFVIVTLALAFTVVTYQSQHNGRIYTGVTVGGVDLGQMGPDEAREALSTIFPHVEEEGIVFEDRATDQRWQMSPADLGLSFDVMATVDAALSVGRVGSPLAQLRDMFESWYFGRTVAPVLLFSESQFDDSLAELASEINQAPVNAALSVDGTTAAYTAGHNGRSLDLVDLRERVVAPLTSFRAAQVELLVHDISPIVRDDREVMDQIQRLTGGGPVKFYFQEPLDDLDLEQVILPQEQILRWLRVEYVTESDGSMRHNVFLDENGVRHWLEQFAEQVFREPVNARYYFDDDTRELVLVAPHVNGRSLDVEATLDLFMERVASPGRSVPFMLDEIVPLVHAGATATELGITELITQTTTWFYGSSDARKHNIARSASNFYGIVIAPGEEFSFNRYLGTVTEDDGYEEGLIIVGGRTIKGIGGGVCQVSTTVFQTAFWAGFPITERWEHGYMLGYYNDGEGPGMDATVFSPIVDFRFINNTPHHLLIENYYNEEDESLTFKFYSTSLGRRVVKEGPVFENIVPAPEEDLWEFDEDLEPVTVRQIDWATEGADVTVRRIVYNADGDELINEFFVSNYIPYPNVYHYGPDVEAPDYSLVPSS